MSDELLRIKNDKGQIIVGILERKLPKESTRGTKIGIICHGVQGIYFSLENFLLNESHLY